jgi:hypothetical protein
VIRITITAEAFGAIAAMLPGSVGFEPEPDAKGKRLIWLEKRWMNRALCGPGRATAT